MIFDTLVRLSLTQSQTEKLRLLRRHKNNELFKQLLQYTYDPFKIYHLKFDMLGDHHTQKKMSITTFEICAPMMFKFLDYLSSKPGATLLDREEALRFAKNHGNIILKVINKSLNCNISATTINKVWPGLIPQFKVQLAKEADIQYIQFPVIVQKKYDGVRMLAIKGEKDVHLYTRNGKRINYPFLARELAICMQPFTVLDGELCDSMGRRTKISGLVNSAIKGGAITEEQHTKNDIFYFVFDWLPLKDFNEAYCAIPYIERASKIPLFALSTIFKVPLIYAKTASEVQTIYDAEIKKGGEGLVLKQDYHKYDFKRSTAWGKLKEIKTADLRCVNTIEGTGKYEGLIGALTCTGIVEGKQVTVNVGSGLTDADRQLPTTDYLGYTIEIKYNSLIRDSKTGQWSLFLPRYVATRFDK